MNGHNHTPRDGDPKPRQGPPLEQSPQQTMEFETAVELLRHDSEQTPVPPTVAKRLNASLERRPKPRPTWWQRLFKR